ncbi:class I SAM-dependent methyltransferase [Shinella yambaruensis]|uniref:class I SAM-dependent methyltransferase n=1 Tax=Shinella yambaruensis TaxID=415996 RepID=UPI003D7BC24C
MFNLSSDQLSEIAIVPHFSEGHYSSLDIERTIDFFFRYYIQPLKRVHEFTADTVVADLGAGYGWLAMAWAIHTPVQLIAVDMDAERLEAGRRIATILGIGDRIDWRVGRLGNLPLEDASVDIACCIEVLEHVYGDKAAVSDLGRVARDLILFTTPNKWFPVIAHDTRLPFCHWLPVRLRVLYAAAVKRDYNEIDNVFWSPADLKKLLPGFRRLNGFMHFEDFKSYLNVFPYYLPYGSGSTVYKIGLLKRLYFKFASKFGAHSQTILPNLASVMKKL